VYPEKAKRGGAHPAWLLQCADYLFKSRHWMAGWLATFDDSGGGAAAGAAAGAGGAAPRAGGAAAIAGARIEDSVFANRVMRARPRPEASPFTNPITPAATASARHDISSPNNIAHKNCEIDPDAERKKREKGIRLVRGRCAWCILTKDKQGAASKTAYGCKTCGSPGCGGEYLHPGTCHLMYHRRKRDQGEASVRCPRRKRKATPEADDDSANSDEE